MYQPQNYYYHNLGVAGHRATSSYSQPFQNRPYYGSYDHPPYHIQNLPLPPANSNNVLQYYLRPALPANQQPGNQQKYPHQQQNQSVNGGISSVLQYDLNNMSSFLSWCAFGMLKQSKNPSADFESLVVSVLFATRLPNSTIIIALEYMNQRFSSNEEITSQNLNEQEIFVYLIVALILANKFNDDNTFTNKSWSGATGLDLMMLNKYERTWLEEAKWSLNVVSFEANILTLEQCWKTWLEKYDRSGAQSNSEQGYGALDTHDQVPSPVSAYTHATSSPIPASYYPQVSQPMSSYYPVSSIPSSPIYGKGVGANYFQSSPSMTSSPLQSDSGSFWRNDVQRSNSNIWNNKAPSAYYHKGLPPQQYFTGYMNDPNFQFMNNAEALYTPFHPRQSTPFGPAYLPHIGAPMVPPPGNFQHAPYSTVPYYNYSAAIC